jgi:LPS sulfotransferase NodH
MANAPDALTLVLATQRSGSTLLCRDIESLGGLGGPRESFLGLAEQAEHESVSEDDILERIARGATESDPRIGAVKMMVGQAPTVDAAIRGGRRRGQLVALQHVVDWALERFERVFMVILVRNALDQAISFVVASSTGLFHAGDVADRAGSAADLVPEDLNPLILAQLQRFLAQRRVLTLIGEEYADRALMLSYAELTRQTERTTDRLVAHARAQGFAPQRTSVTRTMTKVIDDNVSDRLRESFLAYLTTETGLQTQQNRTTTSPDPL